MNRRDLIGVLGSATLFWPNAARAQRPAVPVVGCLGAGSPEAGAHAVRALRKGLAESGYVDGRNVTIEFRWAMGHHEQLPALASELVALNVAVITAPSGTAAVAAKKATQIMPIVFLSSDPVALGLVASLSQPGGNATGVNVLITELIPKRLELLRELLPNARSIALFVNPAGPTAANQLAYAQAAARAIGYKVQALEARSESEIEQAFARLTRRRPDALLVGTDVLFSHQREQVARLAARHGIPAIYDFRQNVAAGGLMSYGTDVDDAIRLVGVYVGRILAGARPADLPVQQPTKFELVINLRTAKALRLTIPPSLLARADEVIQ